jgi:hypothetical protein
MTLIDPTQALFDFAGGSIQFTRSTTTTVVDGCD